MNIFSESSLVILTGLIGIISGLAIKKISNFRRFQGVLIVVAINVVSVFCFHLFIKYLTYENYDTIRGIIASSIFLIIIMIIYATVVRPRQIIKGQSLDDVIMPKMGQGLAFIRKDIWFYEIWWIAITNPNEAQYLELIENQKVSWLKAYWWVFASGLVGFILGILVNDGIFSQIRSDPIQSVLLFIIGLVFGILAVIGFALDSFVTYVVSQVEGGRGNYPSLIHLLSAINAPIIGINSFLVTFGLLNYYENPVSWLVGISAFISLGLVYTAFLGLIATKALNKLTLLRSMIAGIPFRIFLMIVIITLSIYLYQQL